MEKGKSVIITGATGMVGSLILQHCLESDEIKKILSITRRKTGVSHPKLREIIQNDFTNYDNILDHFEKVDIVYFCIGVYTGAVSDEKFKEITVDYTKACVDAIREKSPSAIFCLLSGKGADRTEKSSVAFARYKGKAENYLFKTLDRAFSFRPAYIYPTKKRKEPNIAYQFFRILYPIIKLFGKKSSIQSKELATAMFRVGIENGALRILENEDILKIAQKN